MKRAAVFFDRDNTLIANDGYLGDPDGVVLVDGAADAIARVRGMGFAAITFSNQSGVARGLFTEEAVHAVNARLDELLQEEDDAAIINRHEFCPYHPDGTVEKYRIESELRKPRPGMIFQAAKRLRLDLARSWVIGDAPRDIEAGKAAGCRTILCVDPRLSASPASGEISSAMPDYLVASLKAAVDIIVNDTLGPLDLPPPPEVQAESIVEPQPAMVISQNTAEAPDERASAGASETVMPDIVAPALDIAASKGEVASATLFQTTAPLKGAPEKDVAPKPETSKPRRPSGKMTFADRVKAGTFVPAGKQANAKNDASADGEAGSKSTQTAPAAVKTVIPVKATLAGRVRKPTFAERVKAGTFVPAGKMEISDPPLTAEIVVESMPIADSVPNPAIEFPQISEPTSAVSVMDSPSVVALSTEAGTQFSSSDAPPSRETSIDVRESFETPIESPRIDVPPSIETPVEALPVAAAPPPEAATESQPDFTSTSAEAMDESSSPAPLSSGTIAVDSPPKEDQRSVEAAMDSPPIATAPVVETETKTPSIGLPLPVENKMETSSLTSSADENVESTPVASSPTAEAKDQSAPVARAPATSRGAQAGGATSKKMTFAERVKAGTFQAERASAAGAAAAPERPRRVMPMPGDKPQTQVNRVVESLTSVRPTQPVTPEEQLEPILQSILEELRLTREGTPESDFSLAKLVAGIVQVLVLPALFSAYMHRNVAADMTSMLMLATFLQTLVIALLIMGRS